MRSDRTRRAALAAAFTLVLLSACAHVAGAVVVRGPNGHLLGITPRAGVAPAAIPGSVAARHASGSIGFSSNGNLDYHGGPVLHSSRPYLIFWDPIGEISPASRALFERYFADVAAQSGTSANVYAVDRQFTDSTGFADYKQTFSAASQALVDTHPYPSTGNCSHTSGTYPICLTDGQLQTEMTRVIAADGLPQGTGDSAPIYFVVTPGTVNICADATNCADNTFCAYHDSYANGASTVLYAAIPMFFDDASPLQDPKACQSDGYPQVQEPNADIADVALKYLSHEDSETITDPLGTAWWDSASGNEGGDNCDTYGASVDPSHGLNPNAFLPALGGSAPAGTLYDQLINGNRYYVQSEWSNGDANCEMAPVTGTLSPRFSVPAASAPTGTSITFDPTASTSTLGYTSVTWDFGDGSSPLFSAGSGDPVPVTHSYARGGTYTVALTIVDPSGNLSVVTHTVAVGSPPHAVFTTSPSNPSSGFPVAFDAGASTDPNSHGAVVAYGWSFGDGSAPASGPSTRHVYANAGTYTVTLTVTDTFGLTASTVQQVVVDEAPTARVAVKTAHPAARVAVAFDGSGSRDADGSITSYRWSFGDGSPARFGVAPKHVYARPGRYAVTLIVTDSSGHAAIVATTVTVAADSRIVRTSLAATKKGHFLLVAVDGPGVVRMGSTTVTLRRAGTARLRIVPSAAGSRTLRQTHKLTITLTVSYVPVTGPAVRKRLRLVVRA